MEHSTVPAAGVKTAAIFFFKDNYAGFRVPFFNSLAIESPITPPPITKKSDVIIIEISF